MIKEVEEPITEITEVTANNYDIIEPTFSIVDMEVIEYLYVANFEDILGDDKLMTLILSNGLYKQALCDAFNMTKISLTFNGEEYILNGPPGHIPSTLELLDPTIELMQTFIPVGIKIINGPEDIPMI